MLKISDNQKLLSFCNKILFYNTILESDESRYLFLASLISADTLVDEESCHETLETVDFIEKNLDLFVLSDEVIEETKKYLKKSIDITIAELEDIKRKNKNG